MMESSKTNIAYPEKPNNNPNELLLEMFCIVLDELIGKYNILFMYKKIAVYMKQVRKYVKNKIKVDLPWMFTK